MPARWETLAAWAIDRGWTRGAELGVADGRTFLYLLEHCPQLTMVGVDTWDTPGIVSGPTLSHEVCRCPTCVMVKANRPKTTHGQREAMARAGLERVGRGRLFKMLTWKAAQKFPDASFDFVFVDGDHSAEGVSADIVAWKPKVRPGGMLCGHDWIMRSVRQGVLAHFSPDVIEEFDDHMWAVAC